MAAPDAVKWDQTFGNGMRISFSKQLIKCPRILSTTKRASVGYSVGPQLYPSVCFWTGKKLTMNSFT